MSRWAEIIQFFSVTQGTDSDGFPADIEVLGPNVFANRKSIRSSEFYLASQNGMQLEVMFEVRAADYADETLLMYEGKRYEVKRTYEKTDVIELICTSFDGAVT